jgi:hypothetical protein
MIGFIALIHTTLNYSHYSAIADLDTLQFTVTHALGFSDFTTRILATDLSQSHYNRSIHEVFFSQPHSCNSTDSLPSLLNQLRLPSQETLSIIPSAVPGSSLHSLDSGPKETLSIIPSAVPGSSLHSLGSVQQKTQFPSLLPNNPSIVYYVFVAARTRLPSRCLVMNYSCFQTSCHNTLKDMRFKSKRALELCLSAAGETETTQENIQDWPELD